MREMVNPVVPEALGDQVWALGSLVNVRPPELYREACMAGFATAPEVMAQQTLTPAALAACVAHHANYGGPCTEKTTITIDPAIYKRATALAQMPAMSHIRSATSIVTGAVLLGWPTVRAAYIRQVPYRVPTKQSKGWAIARASTSMFLPPWHCNWRGCPQYRRMHDTYPYVSSADSNPCSHTAAGQFARWTRAAAILRQHPSPGECCDIFDTLQVPVHAHGDTYIFERCAVCGRRLRGKAPRLRGCRLIATHSAVSCRGFGSTNTFPTVRQWLQASSFGVTPVLRSSRLPELRCISRRILTLNDVQWAERVARQAQEFARRQAADRGTRRIT
jgi:hypothetical protein